MHVPSAAESISTMNWTAPAKSSCCRRCSFTCLSLTADCVCVTVCRTVSIKRSSSNKTRRQCWSRRRREGRCIAASEATDCMSSDANEVEGFVSKATSSWRSSVCVIMLTTSCPNSSTIISTAKRQPASSVPDTFSCSTPLIWEWFQYGAC